MRVGAKLAGLGLLLAATLGALSRLEDVEEKLGLAYARQGDEKMSEFRQHERRQGRTALLIGATGATGSKVLQELVDREDWTKVVVIGRRDPKVQSEKVTSIVMDMLDKDAKIDTASLHGIDHFFNCIGTTRADAGSADKFHDIEVGISERVAKAAKEAGISHASVVSAQGADPDRSFAPKWFHPLFYGKTIGLKERALTSQGFPRVTIFRPGMLMRPDASRTLEKVAGAILPSLDVALLARAMVNDAETTPPPATSEEPVIFSGNSLIKKLAATFAPSTSSSSTTLSQE
ncbi:Protein FMP52, mitochondrial [Hondaea fermentalgiana]|uniref:Protein FMP52, mitochondrial n=1 Tax=Hondaea fermentalgiana TaxID=2315210 RepID=A0A2R5GC10_9STRA|nr:Protein FMP52, mitochondrial [Hondaea fermentalgiana]|eukprot:GBG27248.1 Protein FMP52, mitochondrial [Hondaea fermentalgiana]